MFEGIDILEIITMLVIYLISLGIAAVTYGKVGTKMWKTRGERGDYDGTLIRVYNKSPIKTDIKNISSSMSKEMNALAKQMDSFRNQTDDRIKTSLDEMEGTMNKKLGVIDEIATDISDFKKLVIETFKDIDNTIYGISTDIKNWKIDFDPKKLATDIRKGLGGEKGGMIRNIVAEEKDLAQAYADLTVNELPALTKALQDIDMLVENGIITQKSAEKLLKLANSPRWQKKAEEIAKGLYKDKSNHPGSTGSYNGL